MLQKIRKLFWVSRPVSWLNTAYPFAAGYLLTGGHIGIVFIIGTLFFLVSYNLLMYGVNDVFDYESDILNPRKGGIEGMREERALHPTILKAAAIVTVPPATYLFAVSNPAGRITLAFVLFMVVAYSLKYLRFKEIPLLDSFTSACHFAGPLAYALVLTGGWANLGHYSSYVIAFVLWGMASHAFGAVQDIIPDRQGRLASVATVLGAANTVRLAIIFYAVAAILVISRGGLPVVIGLAGFGYIVNVWKFRLVSDAASGMTNRAWKRFIWLNYGTGFVVTMVLILSRFSR